MKKKIDETPHSMKMMWGCIAFAVIAIVLVSSGSGAGAFFLFLIPCMLMIGAMMWMMMGGMGGSPRGGNKR